MAFDGHVVVEPDRRVRPVTVHERIAAQRREHWAIQLSFFPFRSEIVTDHDQIVAVALRRAPAKAVRPAPRPGRGSQAAASPAASAPPAMRSAREVPAPRAHGVASAPAGPESGPAIPPSPPIPQPQPVPPQPQPPPRPTAKKTGTVFDQ
jgi:hypothetical protein